MASLVITTRRTQSGPRYIVRYRLGGRAYPIVHAGSFRTLKEARARRDFVAGEIAAGRNPADALRAAPAAPAPTLTVERWAERFIASRIDVDANTTKNYRTALRKAGETFGDRDPATITVDEVAAWVAVLADRHKAGTVGLYLLTFRLLLDYAGVDPNPARDPRVKKPKLVREEPNPPSAEHVEAILAALGAKWRLLFVTVEQGALRLGEGRVAPLAGRRRGEPPAASAAVGHETRQGKVGVFARVANRSDRADLSARGSRARTSSVPRHHRGQRVSGDDAGLPEREGSALPPARPAPPPDHDLAPVRRPSPRAGGARRSCAAVDEPRRVLARDAAGRACLRAASDADRRPRQPLISGHESTRLRPNHLI